MPKDYYLVLGIPSDASPDDIKEAYRRLAKEFHPDHYGDNGSPFLAIQEAYSVLSDPEKRQSHDRNLGSQKGKRSRPMESMKKKRVIEPLIPGHEVPADVRGSGREYVRPSSPLSAPWREELFGPFSPGSLARAGKRASCRDPAGPGAGCPGRPGPGGSAAGAKMSLLFGQGMDPGFSVPKMPGKRGFA